MRERVPKSGLATGRGRASFVPLYSKNNNSLRLLLRKGERAGAVATSWVRYFCKYILEGHKLANLSSQPAREWLNSLWFIAWARSRRLRT